MIQLIIMNGSTGYDVGELLESVQWSGRKGAAPRSIKFTILDDDGEGHPRIGIDCEQGAQCIFSKDGVELFRGLITDHSQSKGKKLSVTAHDNLYYLANNKDSFCYENKTASQIFTDCMTRIGMEGGIVASTEYIIPELPKAKTTCFDVILDALSSTYKATGKRYYISSEKGLISLTRRSENMLQWVLEVGANITEYTYSKNISKMKTRIRLLSKEDSVVYESINTELENKIGIFTEIESVDDSFNEAQIQELVEGFSKEKGVSSQSLKVSGLGISEVIAGKCIYVVIPHLNIERAFYVDEDSHSFKGNEHTMSLTLNYATDIDLIE